MNKTLEIKNLIEALAVLNGETIKALELGTDFPWANEQQAKLQSLIEHRIEALAQEWATGGEIDGKPWGYYRTVVTPSPIRDF